jgi:hypothetical protein
MLRLEDEYGHIRVTTALIDFECRDGNKGSSCAIGRFVVEESGEWLLAGFWEVIAAINGVNRLRSVSATLINAEACSGCRSVIGLCVLQGWKFEVVEKEKWSGRRIKYVAVILGRL